jgi:hypothetical protein
MGIRACELAPELWRLAHRDLLSHRRVLRRRGHTRGQSGGLQPEGCVVAEDIEGLLVGGSNTPRCLVTKLKGKTLTAARNALNAHGCTVGRIKRSFSKGVKKGHVISAKPKPGSQLTLGAKVTLAISKGKRRKSTGTRL